MKHTRMRGILALLCAAALLLALGACAPLETVKGWFSSDAEPYASYDMDKLVKLGEYKGVEAEFYTQEAYLGLYVENIFMEYQAPKGIEDDPAKEVIAEGDLVFFDYEGTAEGATEDDLLGMKGKGLLVIGSGQFIPGFEEQMAGKPRGEEFDVNVTFPDPYSSETLAGKEAIFKCTVHKIGAESEKVTDEGVFALTGGQFPTVAEFLEILPEEIEQQYQRPFSEVLRQMNMEAAYTAAFNGAEFLKIPAREKKYWDKQLAQEAGKYAEQSGGSSDVDEFAQQNGFESAQALRDEQIKHELFSYAVAAKEDITVTELDLQALLSDIRAGGSETGNDAEIFAKYGGKGRLTRMLMMDKVSAFVYENAKDSPAVAEEG